jgi:acyl-[acyl carrier protein]--UDP-N-acetylglucosamine O-acyltransferase
VAFDEIHIGDYTWIPGAIINPGVKIGKNCVIGVNSLVTRDVPDGCLAAGSPAKIISENVFPRELSPDERADFFHTFLKTFGEICRNRHVVRYSDSAPIDNLTVDEVLVVFKEFLSRKDVEQEICRIIFIAQAVDVPEETLKNTGQTITLFNLKERYIYGFVDGMSERLVN